MTGVDSGGADGAASPVRLVVGCGYLGERVARRWLAEGSRVIGVTRSPIRAAALAGAAILTGGPGRRATHGHRRGRWRCDTTDSA
ncbi:MAG: hypothetical protein ACK6CT_02705, partial [Planctomycetia bacterium]